MSLPATRRARRCLAIACLLAATAALVTGVTARGPSPARAAVSSGYWLVGTDGGVFAFGQAGFYGSAGGIPISQPIVGMATTPSSRGYWLVAADGGIFAFGDAAFHGSTGGSSLNKPVVAMAGTRTGKGYWLVAADGGIFAFGDAGFFGSMAGTKLNKPIVDIAVTPTGAGYWLTATDGGVFAFGDAGFFGSTGGIDLAQRIHAMAPTTTGHGYWMVAGDGGVFAFGDAGFYGSAAGGAAEKRVIDLAPSPTGRGYYVTTSNGQVLAFGDAPFHGGAQDTKKNDRIAAMAAMTANRPPVTQDDVVSVDEDSPLSIDVLANDHDPEGDSLAVLSAGAPTRGVARVSGTGLVYEPAPDQHGTDSFTYVVADARGDTANGQVTVTVRPVNDLPRAVDDSISVSEDTPGSLPVLANDTGLGDGMNFLAITKEPAHGSVSPNPDGTIGYVPELNFNGTDSFRYAVGDADAEEDQATVSVTVSPVNDVPVAADDGPVTISGGESATVDVLANDDTGDAPTRVRLVDPDTSAPTEANTITTAAGEFTRDASGIRFTPVRGFKGTTTVQYVLIDEDGRGDRSSPANVTVDVLNALPQVRDQRVTVEQGQAVTGAVEADDPDGDPLTFRLVDSSAPGIVQLTGDGRFTFGPVDQPGTYTFTFVANDGSADSEVGTVTVEVTPPPPPPPPPPPA